MTRIGKNISLIYENWFSLQETKRAAILSVGVRFFGENMSISLALTGMINKLDG